MKYATESPRFSVRAFRQRLDESSHLLFSSSNVDEAKASVGRVMTPHELNVINNNGRLDASMHYMPLGDISLYRLKYGSSVSIHIPTIKDYYCIQIPIHGHACVTNGSEKIESTESTASVLNPEVQTDMVWDYDNDQFMVRISRSLMERTAIGILGHDIDDPIRFDVGFRWQDCPAWYCLLSYLLDFYANSDPSLRENKLITSQLNQLTATTLFLNHKHSQSEEKVTQRTSIRPRHIKRAQEYMEAHAHEPISVELLAQVCGISIRSLYSGFKDFVGTTPMQYLRNLRLDHVRNDLLTSEATSVTSVAMRWGFSHMGRFSAEYKARFGESPSQTFRKR
ncbi:AraC family transcriptional regulator [Vibrio penaeicida]|uniref:AraC family transcriptional regulator n=1 Tax=Vibrio penaeicida TaxID=104609 RepID=A0AAV5NUN5_9VIBR|nr:AraC family transcriptional regulator [Vibrio penaeicida]RTZ21208.1 AraC family transcriptional regulator [Vibrio penaeicida]GLQ74039.1 AraC family transcriptional regulator [Vibrio penaeicida]